MAKDSTVRRVTVSNDDGDVYVETSGASAEIVLKSAKVRVDGDVHCYDGDVGIPQRVDGLAVKDTALSGRIDALNATDAELKNKDITLSERIDALNATDAELKTKDAELSVHVASLNATDAALKGVDEGLSSRIDALVNVYIHELNLTDKQLVVTDATLGSRVDTLNATQYELKGADAGLSIRIDALNDSKAEFQRVDNEVAALIASLNATDVEMKAKDTELSGQIDTLTPSVCMPPGGYRLHFDGNKWLCACSENWMGEMCDTTIPMTAEVVKLTQSGSSQYADFFGHAVAISSDTVIVGAPKDHENGNSSGSAYVFVRSGMTWIQSQKLSPSDASGGGGKKFGNAVSISGNVAIIAAYDEDQPGAPSAGAAYVLLRSFNTWTQQQKLLPRDVMAYAYFGASVAVSGDSVFITSGTCTSCLSQAGAVYVFLNEEGAFVQRQKLTYSGAHGFGSSISVSGDTVIIGAPGEHSKDGAAYVFVLVGASWTLQQKLQASNGTSGAQFGISVAVSGDTAMVGANLDSINAYRAGSVHVFVRSEGTWTLQQQLSPPDQVYEGRFGGLVAISGDKGVVSAWSSPSASAYIYVRSGTNWTQQGKLMPSDGKRYFVANAYAVAIAMSDDSAVVGLPDNHVRGNAYIFT